MKKVLQFRFAVKDSLSPNIFHDHLHFDKETSNETLPLQAQYCIGATYGIVTNHSYIEKTDTLVTLISYFREINETEVDSIKELMKEGDWFISWDTTKEN